MERPTLFITVSLQNLIKSVCDERWRVILLDSGDYMYFFRVLGNVDLYFVIPGCVMIRGCAMTPYSAICSNFRFPRLPTESFIRL